MANVTQSKVTSIEFAQFTATLITQTLDAVVSAQLAQEERVRKLLEVSILTPEQFAEQAISENDLSSEMQALFPEGLGAGTAYLEPSEKQIETPPVLALTGYVIKRGDIEKKGQSMVITQTGYLNILNQIKVNLAERQQANIRQMVQRGIPRVVVDHGKVNAKINFQFSQSTPATTSVTQPVISGSGRDLKTAAPFLMPMKLSVKAVDFRQPEIARLMVNVVGEVEITFKTITG